jgi:hypothetical protein
MRAAVPLIIDPTWSRSYTDKNLFYRTALYNVIESDKKLISNGVKVATALSKVGKDSTIYWKELEYYKLLIDYLIIMKEEVAAQEFDCVADESEELNEFLLTYNLDCIRNTYLCQYGNTGNRDFTKNNLIEMLVSQLTLCCVAGFGISTMNINNPDCNTFAIYPVI